MIDKKAARKAFSAMLDAKNRIAHYNKRKRDVQQEYEERIVNAESDLDAAREAYIKATGDDKCPM